MAGRGTLHYATLRYTTLRYATLRYTTLHYTTLRYATLHYPRYTTLHYATLRYATLHYPRYTTLHYATLHYTTVVRTCPLLHRQLSLPFTDYDMIRYDMIRYDTRCCCNVRSHGDMSQLNLLHGSTFNKLRNYINITQSSSDYLLIHVYLTLTAVITHTYWE